MMLTALFLVWLQMGAQAQNCNVIMNGSMICQDHQGYITEYSGEFVMPSQTPKIARRAADETDGKPQEYQKPVDLYPIICGGSPPHPCNEPPAEPVDVPAVQKWREIYFSCMAPSLGHCTNSDCTDAWCVPRKEKQRYYTCADKSRVLLTDESGKKHCIKF